MLISLISQLIVIHSEDIRHFVLIEICTLLPLEIELNLYKFTDYREIILHSSNIKFAYLYYNHIKYFFLPFQSIDATHLFVLSRNIIKCFLYWFVLCLIKYYVFKLFVKFIMTVVLIFPLLDKLKFFSS